MEPIIRPVIVISGYTVGLAVIRALGEKGVPVVLVTYDPRDVAHRSRYVREVVTAPHPETAERDFVRCVMDLASRLAGSLIVPASDAALAAVSRNKELLERHFAVACTRWDVTQLYIDKRLTYRLAEAAGVPVPRTIYPTSVRDIERSAGLLRFPCVVKPSQSHLYYARFGRKWVRAGDPTEAIEAFREAARAGLEVVVQELIAGDAGCGANYISYAHDGRVLAEFTARKVRNAPAETGSPGVAVSESIPEVAEAGRKVVAALGYYGFSCIEFKKDPRDGVYRLLDVNGRHNLSSMLALRCGINFPWMQYRHLMHGVTPERGGFAEGVYWIDAMRDIRTWRAHLRQGHSLGQIAAPYFRRHVFAFWDAADVPPFVVHVGNAAVGLAAALIGRVKKRLPSPRSGGNRVGRRAGGRPAKA